MAVTITTIKSPAPTLEAMVEKVESFASTKLMEEMGNLIDLHHFEDYSVTLSSKESRYKVASALQKSIRRGEVYMAVYTAAAIFNSKEREYLWRRLPIIALEDVGPGNWQACAYILHFCRYKSVRTKLGEQKGLHALVAFLANNYKSRGLCEAVCTAYFASQSDPMTSYGMYFGSRMLALGWTPESKPLSKMLILSEAHTPKGIHQETLSTCLEHGNLHAAYAYWASTKKSVEYLHTPIRDYVQFFQTEPVSTIVHNLGTPILVGGVPEWTYDQHTIQGRAAISRLLKSGALPPGTTFKQLGMALFQAESALVNREVTTPSTKQIQDSANLSELLWTGLSQEQADTLMKAVRSEEIRALLRTIRQQVVAPK